MLLSPHSKHIKIKIELIYAKGSAVWYYFVVNVGIYIVKLIS